MDKIIIVGSSWIIAKYVEMAVGLLGYRLVFLVNMNDFSPQVAEEIKKNEWYDVNINSFEETRDFLEKKRATIGNIIAVTS